MESVLHKTMQSLETALRYNPTSVELMASLAEVYVRLGRFDRRTMELCEAVLSRQGENLLLRQAQGIGLLAEQARALEEGLAAGETPPPPEALAEAIRTLEEFQRHSGECTEIWIAWTRFQALSGRFVEARRGLEILRRQNAPDLDRILRGTLQHMAGRPDLDAGQLQALGVLMSELGAGGSAIKLLERQFDEEHPEAGPALLRLYQERYSPDRPEEMPESVRARFFRLLLDFGEREATAAWLRKAALLGWQTGEHSLAYAHALMEEGQLDDAFAVLQRLALTPEVKELLNGLSELYEHGDEIEKAVAVLRYINDHELEETDTRLRQEEELAREAELSMAELQLRNGRVGEALNKYVSAFCLSPQVDPELLERIDGILETDAELDLRPLVRLGEYFRRQGDHPKALFYLNQAMDREPDNPEVLDELTGLMDDILQYNPNLPQLRLELGELYLRTGKLELAMQKLREATSTPETAGRANRGLALASLHQGRLTEALERYRKASIGEGDFADLFHLHEALLERQSWREALAALDLIARQNPSWRDVAERARQLEERMARLQPAEAAGDPKMRELIGDNAVGRYQFVEKIGSGGMGVVYKVLDLRSQQTVAMKILRDSLAGSAKALERFFREARIAATIHHRNIVNIFDYNISNTSGQSYIVMEYVDGPCLREIIDRQFQETMSVSLDYVTEILYYTVQLCDALEAAHGQGIVHRDIKPDNIMLTTRGEIKITDFGIVHVEEATFTPTGAMLGTPRYMSPEQVTGGKIDGRSDIYSVGILIYEALVGSPPFVTGDISYQQLHNPPIAPRDINPVIPQGVEAMILKCLAKRPEDRFMNAHSLKGEVARQLENLGGCAKFGGLTMPEIPGSLGLDTELDL